MRQAGNLSMSIHPSKTLKTIKRLIWPTTTDITDLNFSPNFTSHTESCFFIDIKFKAITVILVVEE